MSSCRATCRCRKTRSWPSRGSRALPTGTPLPRTQSASALKHIRSCAGACGEDFSRHCAADSLGQAAGGTRPGGRGRTDAPRPRGRHGGRVQGLLHERGARPPGGVGNRGGGRVPGRAAAPRVCAALCPAEGAAGEVSLPVPASFPRCGSFPTGRRPPPGATICSSTSRPRLFPSLPRARSMKAFFATLSWSWTSCRTRGF